MIDVVIFAVGCALLAASMVFTAISTVFQVRAWLDRCRCEDCRGRE